MPPTPIPAMFSLSLGAVLPRADRTQLGTIVSADTAAPAAPAAPRTSRRVRPVGLADSFRVPDCDAMFDSPCGSSCPRMTHDRPPAVDIYEALAYTVPGIIAHESALNGGVQMKIPQYDRS